MTPMPFSAGQMSLLTSFICHSWCEAPSVEPLATTMSRHASTLSRQYAQPLIDAFTKAIAWPQYSGSARRRLVGPDGVLQHADAVFLVGRSTLRSSGVYSSPVSGFTASSTCAYSL